MSRSVNYSHMARSLKLVVLKTYLSLTHPANLIFEEEYLKKYSVENTNLVEYM